MIFANEKVYYDGIKATSKEGTIAGSTTMISKIIKRLIKANIITNASEVIQLISNPYDYHNVDLDGSIEWDEDFNIIKVDKK